MHTFVPSIWPRLAWQCLSKSATVSLSPGIPNALTRMTFNVPGHWREMSSFPVPSAERKYGNVNTTEKFVTSKILPPKNWWLWNALDSDKLAVAKRGNYRNFPSRISKVIRKRWLLGTTKTIKPPAFSLTKTGRKQRLFKVFHSWIWKVVIWGAVPIHIILCSPFFSVFTILVGRGVETPVEVTLNGVVKFIPATIKRITRSYILHLNV